MYTPSKYELLFLLCIAIERLGGGIFTTIPTTCQLDFANLYNVSVDEVAKILSARSFGALAGSIVAPVYFYYEWGKKYLDPMTICSSMMIIMSVMIAFAPLMPSLSLLFWDILIANIFFGFLDLALQNIIIQCWGAKSSMPVVQLYHMLWAVGSIIAPYVTLPFTIEGEEAIDEICGIDNSTLNSIDYIDQHISLTDFAEPTNNDQVFPPKIFYSWLICACFWLISGLIGLFIGISRSTRHIYESHHRDDLKSESNDVESEELSVLSIKLTSDADKINNKITKNHKIINYWKYEAILLIFVILAYACIGGPEHWVPDLVYNYAVCVREWTTASSSTLVSSFWFSYTAGRILGVFLINLIPIKLYLAVDFIGAIISYIVLIFNSDATSSDTIVWIFTCTLGLSYATMYPTGVSLTGQYFDNTKLYSIIFGLGNFTGQMLVPLGASLALNDPQMFFTVGAVFCACYIVPMGTFLLTGNYFQKEGLLRPEYCSNK